MKLVKNKAQCNHCQDILESTHRHDFVVCSCFKDEEGCTGIFIDGGLEYARRGGNLTNLIELCEYEEES